MSKEFVVILVFVLVTLGFWGVVATMRLQKKEIAVDIDKEEIYRPLDPTLDLEFLSQLESGR